MFYGGMKYRTKPLYSGFSYSCRLNFIWSQYKQCSYSGISINTYCNANTTCRSALVSITLLVCNHVKESLKILSLLCLCVYVQFQGNGFSCTDTLTH